MVNAIAKRKAKKKPQPRLNPGTAKTLADLAKQVGRAWQSVNSWTKRDDWPFGEPPYKVKLVKEWMNKTLGARAEHSSKLTEVKIKATE